MELKKAEDLKKKNLHLVGQKHKGTSIDEIVIAPSGQEEFMKFIELYNYTSDAEKALLPFQNSDLKLMVVCGKESPNLSGMLLYEDLQNLKNHFDVYEE